MDVKINSEQKIAIDHENGPILVVAGAGTGKTTVITERIKFLLSQNQIKPSEVLALTFTEKAAEEMLSRVDEIMPFGYEEPWLSTFHAFGERILRSEALEIGLSPSYKVLTAPQQWILIRKHLFDFNLKYYRPLGNPTKFISALLKLFSRAKDEIVTVEDFVKYANSQEEEHERWMEVAGAYKKYQELLLLENAMDFGDLLLWTIHLFKNRPMILKKYQQQFKYILIDEFQDTNFAQYQIIKLLAPPSLNPNIMIVSDDDQAIFRFRGAAVWNITNFLKDYHRVKTIVLTKNYRSTQKILDSSYKLIQNNNPDRLEVKLKIDKRLISTRDFKGDNPIIFSPPTMEEEAEIITEKIINHMKENGYNFGDFAILARANNHLDPLVASFKRHNLPYTLIGNRGLFDQDEIKGLTAYLRFIASYENNVSLYQLLLSPYFNFSPEEITSILHLARSNKISLWESLNKASVKSKHALELIHLNEKLKHKIHNLSTTQLMYKFITSTGLIKKLLDEETIESALKIKNINLFFGKIKTFETQTENPTVFEFVDYLDLLVEAGDNPAQAEIEDIDTIKLLTTHSAKGLEFPVVFITSLSSDRFPSRKRQDTLQLPVDLVKEKLPDGDFHVEEERRLFYVGMTRAKDFLYLSYAKNYGGVREKKPTGFLSELIAKEEIIKPKKTEEPDEKPKTNTASQKPEIALKYVSYSQLETFKTCPLKYYYKYILGVVGSPSAALNFGQIVHRSLRDFHKSELIGKKVNEKEFLILYENHFQELAHGFMNKQHKIESYNRGKEILSLYYKKHKEIFGEPVFLEQKFTINIDGIFLIGSIDRVDKKEDGSYEVIDYKTGESENKEKNIDRDEQLTIYAMAANEYLNIKPQNYSLYFLEDQKKVSTTRTDEKLTEKKEDIKKTIEEIKKGNFPAKVSMLCEHCEFNQLCPSYKIGKNNY